MSLFLESLMSAATGQRGGMRRVRSAIDRRGRRQSLLEAGTLAAAWAVWIATLLAAAAKLRGEA